ncbi:MAG TPA: 2-amino-4-hydroxy-6-hydroxymethyldihydropteridine diphosphokinase [Candidatus Polarisedimenticolia bacterium]|nr:2-amino-4-hydroxy-6-hydroxymethyldihydropteridine diphosphokinase [Candidatus Polarisedimenticolia bacterium]
MLLGAGSRHGDRLTLLGEAVRLLASRGLRVALFSSVWETEPVGLPKGPPLLNGALALEAALPPEAVLAACLEVERVMGRSRSPLPLPGRPDPGHRPIDLDLLLAGPAVLDLPGLSLPHPRLHQRRFVLEPLAEIAPRAVHPVLRRDIASLLRDCPDRSWVRRFASAEAWRAAASLQPGEQSG